MQNRRHSEFELDFNKAMDLRESKPCEALAILKNLENKFPKEAVIKGTIASIYFTYLKQFDEALPYAREATLLSPRSELASITLFHTLVNLGLETEAFDEARRFIKRNGVTQEYEFLFNELDDNGVFD